MPSEKIPSTKPLHRRNRLLHPCVTEMCHMKAIALTHERGMMLKLVSTMPMWHHNSASHWDMRAARFQFSMENSCLLLQGCQDGESNINPSCSHARASNFYALAIEHSIILQGSSSSKFQHTEKDAGVRFMSLQIFRTWFQFESRKLFLTQKPLP